MTRELVVRWLDWQREPLRGWVYELTLNGSRRMGTLPPDGIMRVTVDDSVRRAQFRVSCPYSRELQELLEAGCCKSELRGYLLIGALEGPSSAVGVQQRLRNLGYYDGPIEDGIVIESSPDDHWLRQCIRRFQHDEGRAETGEIDTATQLALATAYGDEGGRR